MGDLSKTIVIQVPPEIVYQSLKDRSYLDYTQDLRKMLTSIPTITKDIPNSLLSFSSSNWGTKADTEYILKPFNEKSCEITINVKYKLALGTEIRIGMINEIHKFKALEFGYSTCFLKGSKQAHSSPQ